MSAEKRREEKLKRRLQRIVKEQDLTQQREFVAGAMAEQGMDALTCAAALIYLSHPQLFGGSVAAGAPVPAKSTAVETSTAKLPWLDYKMVRYRLDVGLQHQVAREQIQDILVQESGVDKRRIGRIDIRQHYTLVELPDGMPTDIFQLLTEAAIGPHKLNIRRVRPNKFRQARGKSSAESAG
ncbi:DbpA RNA binding domain-containing protein [Methylomonas sp. MED-D]|uniref:DbpA RNA binding domain-containing protein n=1 Tax=unclassified Methylomonas TaxID=2608980 RepID=UPI0028A56F38|nr:DbpA RNA binding domain-containing protein [Methylomonas sp. MV1]MDT4330935.1 DbpA RNA binding domain-containing protein [Methylomonas sp. MV1]